MRRKSSENLVLVLSNCLQPVDVEHPIRVDCDQDGAGVRVDEVSVIAQPQVPEQRRLVEIRELDHVFHTGLAQVLSGAHLRTIPS